MRRIYWDSMLFVYFFEDNPGFSSRVEGIYNAMRDREDQLCASPLVFGEVLVGPTKGKNEQAQNAISHFFHSTQVSLLNLSMESAPIFAALRASGIKPPDAMNLAIAATHKVDLFLTNDTRLHKIALPNMPFIATLETDLF